MKILNFLLLTLFSSTAWAAQNACEQALDAGDPGKAISQAQAALKTDQDKRVNFICLGRAQSELGKHEEALVALQSAEKLSTQPLDRMIVLTLEGNTLRAANQLAEAMNLYRQSLEIAVQDKNSAFQLINRNQLGSVLEERGDIAAALEHYQQGLSLAANDNERANSHARIAHAHSDLGQHDKAVEHQLKSVLFEERAGDFNHYAHATLELVRISLVAKQYADAEKWLGKFLGTIAEAGDSYWQAKARLLLAQVKSANGEGSAAREQYAQAKAMAERIGARQLLGEIVKAESTL